MPRRVLFIANGKARRGGNAAAAVTALRDGGLDVSEAPCASRAALTEAIRVHRHSVDAVVVGGGDGTINAAAAGLLKAKLPLGIIPLGTANDLARTLGIPSRVEEAAAIIVADERRRIDLGVANEAFFFNVASLGLSAKIARTLRGRDKRRFGVFGYAIAAAKVAVRVRPFHAEISHDGETLSVRTVQIAVGNGRYYGGGLAIAADAAADDGMLDAYSLEVSGWPRLLALLPALRRGMLEPPSDVRTIRTRALNVVTSRPQPVDLDGDIGAMTPVAFSVLRGAIEVFAPPPRASVS